LNWAIPLHTGSAALSKATTAPAAPTGVAGACASPTTNKTMNITWTAVTHASSYTIFDSQTSGSSGFSSLATGVVSSPYTNSTLATGNYWFEVAAKVGSNWVSVNSSATAEFTLASANPFCKSP
jgi:hypothetical protein